MTLIIYPLLFLVIFFSVLNINTDYFGPLKAKYISKPLVLVSIMLICLFMEGKNPSSYRWVIMAALLFSMIGDIFLMLESDKFIQGLVSFLISHIFFIFAFSINNSFQLTIYILPLAIYGLIMYFVLYPNLKPMLKIPVFAYISIIMLMVYQAITRFVFVHDQPSLLILVGAVLFMISDSVLAINRFKVKFKAAQLIILATYFSAQTIFAFSV